MYNFAITEIMLMKRFIFLILLSLSLILSSCASSKVEMSRDELMDKIKGAWAGQTIGCTYGGL